MSYREIQNTIKKNKNFCDYTHEEFEYAMKPIGKALYGRPVVEDKALPTDRITCEICSKEFIRSGRSNHNKTIYHQVHANMNDKIRKLLINK